MARTYTYGLFLLLAAFVMAGSRSTAAEGLLEFTGTVHCDGKPVAGAAATLHRGNVREGAVTTDEGGKFRFDLPYGRSYTITVEKESYITMIIEINTTVPGKSKGFSVMYTTRFDIFREKEGFEARLARDPLLRVEYIPSKNTFGTRTPYENTVTYTPVREQGKPVFMDKGIESVKEEPVKRGEEKPAGKAAQKEESADPEEVEYMRANEEERRQAERQEDLAETTAGEKLESDPGRMATERQAGSVDERMSRKMENGALHNDLEKDKEAERADVLENRKVKAGARKRFMADIADALREEKNKKKVTTP